MILSTQVRPISSPIPFMPPLHAARRVPDGFGTSYVIKNTFEENLSSETVGRQPLLSGTLSLFLLSEWAQPPYCKLLSA